MTSLELIDEIVRLTYYGEKAFLKGSFENRKRWLKGELEKLVEIIKSEK